MNSWALSSGALLLNYYTTEYFGIVMHTTGLAQALQILAQMDLFINILKHTF